MDELEGTEKYKFCNHHHELTEEQELIDLGTGLFVADKKMIPLLRSLNELGLITRTHNYNKNGSFVSIILNDKIRFEIRKVNERDSSREDFNGETELLITF